MQSFKEWLREKSPELQEDTPLTERLSELNDVVNDIREEWLKDTGIEMAIEPGYQVNYGQQYNVKIFIPAKHFEETLFRAYIPTDGQKVHLDFYGEQLISCDSPQEFLREIKAFLSKPEIKSRFKVLIDMSRHSSG
jgi:hypothetical protein